ncbi:hypothetical protein PsorP6_019575 [Peronosclerospora sorghi]|nr:hypothetical protein PsorP6_019575 [Peronosclerospora sorghi]
MNAWMASIWFAALVLLLDPERRVTCALPQLATNQSNATTQGLVQAAEAGNEERGPGEIAQRIEEALGSENELVRKWKSERKTGLAVLEEAQGGSDLLETLNGPNMNALVQFFENSPHEKPLIELLLEKYHVHDIAEALERASHWRDAKTNADKLRGQLFDRLMTDGTSAVEFFDLLKLPHDENMFSEYNLLFFWGHYATLLHPKFHPNDKIPAIMIPALAVIPALASIVGGEKKLVEIIWLGTKKNDGFPKLEAEMVESQLFEYWSLRVDKQPAKLLEMEQYPPAGSSAWLAEVLKYIDYYNMQHPTEKFYFTKWINERNGDEAVEDVLSAAQEANDRELVAALDKDYSSYLSYSKQPSANAVDLSLVKAADTSVVKAADSSVLEAADSSVLKADDKGDTGSPKENPPSEVKTLIAKMAKRHAQKETILRFLEVYKTISADKQMEMKSQLMIVLELWYLQGLTPSKLRTNVFNNDDTDKYTKLFLTWYKRFYKKREKELTRRRRNK